MILKDLINRNDWSSVKYHLLRLYPDQEKNIDGYADVYDSLVLATPRKTAMRIVVEEARDFEK